MAVIPIRANNRILGLIHLADRRANMLSSTRVRMFEEVGLLLGTAIERVTILQALQESEATARALLDATADLAMLVEPDGTIIALNEPQARVWGRSKKGLVGQNAFNLLLPDLVDATRADLAVALSSRKRKQLGEIRDGKRTYDGYVSPIVGQDGTATRAAVYTRDVTAIKQTEAELRQAHDRLAALLALSGELISVVDLKLLLDLVLEKLATVVRYDNAAILTVSGDTLTVEASPGSTARTNPEVASIPLDGVPVIRDMIRTREPFYVPDVQALEKGGRTAEAITGLPLATFGPNARSLLTTPLLAKEKIIGILCLGHHEPYRYNAEALHIVQTFANEAAIAISNARLYQQAQATATAEERSRLAHELHDSVTQALFSANLIATALPAAFQRDAAEATDTLQKLLRLIRGALAQMRTFLLELVPAGLAQEELGTLLSHLCQAMAAEIGAPVDLIVEGQCALLTDQRIALYRITQEALYNVAKHAEATRVAVRLICQPGITRLQISDNGHGFTPGSVPASHMGVNIMRERAESIGGAFEIESRVGQGTQIRVTLKARARGDGCDHDEANSGVDRR